jgi:hypothetical protein
MHRKYFAAIIGLSLLSIGSCSNTGRFEASDSVLPTIGTLAVGGRTHVIALNKTGLASIIGSYPKDPAFDSVSGKQLPPGFFERYPNGSALILVPDNSAVEQVRAWNDLDHTFDVLFADPVAASRGVQAVTVVLKGRDTLLRIFVNQRSRTGFIFQVEEKTCLLTSVDDNGGVRKAGSYTFKAFPDVVNVESTPKGFLITHDNIDNEEQLLLDPDSGKATSLSFKEHSDAEKH